MQTKWRPWDALGGWGATRHMLDVLDEIGDERVAQHAKWGEQNHPDGIGYRYLARKADIAKRECDTEFASGNGSWRLILREEYAEALGSPSTAELRAELVQVAAVAAAWIEAIDRRGKQQS